MFITEDAQVDAIEYLKSAANYTADKKGWWKTDRCFGEQIALMHSELSEALEEYRFRGLEGSTVDGKPVGVTSELADVLIRIFDTCEHYNLPLGRTLVRKMKYNETRPYRHGGKLL